MVPIKSNHHPNQYPPSDHAEIKSQPFKLPKITALMAVQGGYLRFLSWWFYSTFFLPMISACRWLSPHYLPSSAPTLPLSLSVSFTYNNGIMGSFTLSPIHEQLERVCFSLK
ncbi:hypothetical protein HanXRQr2_Chr03g0113101 [Helianthus annuus]|uniref:Uncharacterized protein n=1 Tax=Helianthus annuus TaxID=4232 RepID=A0A9K3JGA6_HELAN|nr:hypothetical protein HanXRQr2_Chr03g0113101 [Helianthus annuus]KAJ0601016.1 hypothetical protein HanIR_Chr03g0123611 [Helianthus annuus]KAJ0774043.1 hypothetical protein HanOQP8_Chr03g0107131 [Helianthus annuus]KAJ0943854.1 hypothetical protein HanPSC8_Chr03g0109481 [Helianthus annuus]